MASTDVDGQRRGRRRCSWWLWSAWRPGEHWLRLPARPATRQASSSRDIVFILLDGYPRADRLATSFEFDNGPFLDQMAAVGFDVAARSRSNYNTTMLSLASMMNATHADALMPEPPTGLAMQGRALGRLIAEAHSWGRPDRRATRS